MLQKNQKPGGLYASNYGYARMVNSLFYGNSPNDLGAFTNESHIDHLYLSHSIVPGGNEAISLGNNGTLTWGGGNNITQCWLQIILFELFCWHW